MDIDLIIERLKNMNGLKNDREVAMLFDMKTSNFSARKKSGSLFCVIAEWATENEIDVNWLLRGVSPSKRGLEVETLDEANEWLAELIKKEPYRKEWFRAQFEDAFPAFKEWKKRKEESESNQGEFPRSKVI